VYDEMGAVGESIAVVAGAAVLTLLSKRSWAWISALAIAASLLAVSLLGLFAHMTYFSLRSASFAMAFACAVGHSRSWTRAMTAAGALALALVSAAWLLVTGGTITTVVGKSVDPSQRALIVDTIDASGGLLSTIVVGLLVAAFAVWSSQRLSRP
jgi:hypothetical protein